MTRGGFVRKASGSGEDGAGCSYKITNSKLDTIYSTPPLLDFLHVQFLRYMAHVVRRDNAHPTKTALFIEPTRKNTKSPWSKVQFLLGLDKDHCIKKMTKKVEVERALESRFTYLKSGATGQPAKRRKSSKKSSSR